MAESGYSAASSVESIESATALVRAATILVDAFGTLGNSAMELYRSIAIGDKVAPMREYSVAAPFDTQELPKEFLLETICESLQNGTFKPMAPLASVVESKSTVFAKPSNLIGQYVADVTRQAEIPPLKKEFAFKVREYWQRKGTSREDSIKVSTYQCHPKLIAAVNEKELQRLLRQGSRLEQCARRLYSFAMAYWNAHYDVPLDISFESFELFYRCISEGDLTPDISEQRAVVMEEIFLNAYLTREMHPIYCYLINNMEPDILITLMQKVPTVNRMRQFPLSLHTYADIENAINKSEKVIYSFDLGIFCIYVTRTNLYEIRENKQKTGYVALVGIPENKAKSL